MTLFSFVLLAHTPAVAAQKFRDPDSRRQWHDVSWGSRPKEDMKCKAGEVKNLVVCERPSNSGDRAIGALEATRVTYRYFEDRLFRIDVLFTTDEPADELGTVLHQVYGPGAWDAGTRSERWQGDSIAITWGYTLREPGATLTYLYLPLMTDVTAATTSGNNPRFVDIADGI